MMIFRPMQEADYAAWLAYFIPDYAVEIADNYGLAAPAARAQAQQEIAESLPEGAGTPGQVLLCLIERVGDAERQVGYLWYKPDAKMRSAFICDFYIHPDSQGKGLGKRAMAALENDLRLQGFAQIKLRVAGDNARARRLYEASGFGVTGINMSKNIDAG
ncbi:GNAT family N-acetyltransferase [Raoultella terrigena]|uniref:GNAT family N-acetyltransferase n=1 Tax=Raoultella terrigena TaxID=577 RepID=UPI0005F86E4F|nr:GNAT family N-acetyltransferase [Raoultella terrigena]